ncbi:hypothetical protein XENTR_v10009848 [Xenopus tropicalis]|nr:hypothetical protein XENTR_v10009848 [Xenopus tropicalis]
MTMEIPEKDNHSSKHLWAQRRLLVVLVILLILVFIFLIILTSLVFIYYSTVSSEISKLQSQDSSLSSEISKLQSQDSSVSNEISKLKTQDSSLSSEISKLQSQDSSVSNEISKLKTQDSSISDELKKLKGQGSICDTCPSGWNRIGASCYYFSKETATWERALNACIGLKAMLLILRDPTEMEYVNRLAERGSRHWIGLKRESSNVWKWLDGTQMTFRNWGVGEPNNDKNQESCTETMEGPWNDRNCEHSLHYICKRTLSCSAQLLSI